MATNRDEPEMETWNDEFSPPVEVDYEQIYDTARDAPMDARIPAMPLFVRHAVLEYFLGNVDEAVFQGVRYVQTFKNPPDWARYLHDEYRRKLNLS